MYSLFPVSHEWVIPSYPALNLFHSPWHDAHQLCSSLSDDNIILYPDPSSPPVLIDPVHHNETAELWVSQGTVNQEVNKVTARLNCKDLE